MGLDEIAAGVEVVAEQREGGVPTVDRTDDPLADRLEPFAGELPCSPAEAAALVDAYAAGKSVGAAARVAGVAPTDGAKALHLFGEHVSPVGPMGREIVADWLAGELPRTEAVELAGVSDQEFALAAFVETHDPIEGAMEAVEGALSVGDVDKRETLGDAMDGPGDVEF
ncbi:DUF7858 family protein [Halosimplex halophilum]|uniref:DUF7858 family protein n=1 Tax=Halosimplex halophilum TaxID=2559572 RepID=UPI00107F3DD8|nr:hypothetical protein [Halosimplex halophilum]